MSNMRLSSLSRDQALAVCPRTCRFSIGVPRAPPCDPRARWPPNPLAPSGCPAPACAQQPAPHGCDIEARKHLRQLIQQGGSRRKYLEAPRAERAAVYLSPKLSSHRRVQQACVLEGGVRWREGGHPRVLVGSSVAPHWSRNGPASTSGARASSSLRSEPASAASAARLLPPSHVRFRRCRFSLPV